MLISVEAAAYRLDTKEAYVTNPNSKYGKFYKKGKFDITAYENWENEKQKEEDYILETVGLAEFVCSLLGTDLFYKQLPTLRRQKVREGILAQKFSKATAVLIRETYEADWLDVYLNSDPTVAPAVEYVPLEERIALTDSYVMAKYWANQKTTSEIANELNVPESWVRGEIRRLGLQKKENGIIRKGRKGYKMPDEIKVKHQNQPHAKPIVQICPKTFIIIQEYNSQGAVERYGYKRGNVRKAIKTGGLSKGYLWAFKGYETVTINIAKKRGTLEKKVQAYEYKKPTKTELEKIYILQNRTLEDCAEYFKCNKTTIARLAGKYGLKKRTSKIDMVEVKRLYLEEGLSAKEIAERTGRTPKTIASYLSRAGIKRCN